MENGSNGWIHVSRDEIVSEMASVELKPPLSERSPQELKLWIRKSIPASVRSKVWLHVTGTADFMKTNPIHYGTCLNDVFPSREWCWRDLPEIPTFGCDWVEKNERIRRNIFFGIENEVGLSETKSCGSEQNERSLSSGIENQFNRLMCVLQFHHPNIRYCPVLPHIVFLALTILSEEETFCLCCCLLQRSQKDGWYLQPSASSSVVFVHTFGEILNGKLPKLVSHFSSIISYDPLPTCSEWFSTVFSACLTESARMRVMDVFMNEGSKVLYRVALAIFSLCSDELLHCSYSSEIGTILQKCARTASIDKILSKGFSFRLHRKHFAQIDQHHQVFKLLIPHTPSPVLSWPNFDPDSSRILSRRQVFILWTWIPESPRHAELKCLFSTAQNGFSLSSMLNECDGQSPTIIVMKDSKGNSCGVFLARPFSRDLKPQRDCQAFVFSLHPHAACFKWTQNEVDVLVTLSTEQVAVGDSGSHAIFLPKSMETATTAPTAGFGNTRLIPTESGDFRVVEIEVWGFHDKFE
eukprot:192698_1